MDNYLYKRNVYLSILIGLILIIPSFTVTIQAFSNKYIAEASTLTIFFIFCLVLIRNFTISNINQLLLFLLCLIYCLYLTFVTINVYSHQIINLLFLFQILPVFIFFTDYKKLLNKVNLKILLILLIFFSFIISFVQYVDWFGIIHRINIDGYGGIIPLKIGDRSPGYTRSVIHFSTIVFFYYLFYLNSDHKNSLINKILITILVCFCIIFSGSRGALLGLIFFWGYLFFSSFKEYLTLLYSKKNLIKLIILISLILIIGFIFVDNYGCGRFCDKRILEAADESRIYSYLRFFDDFKFYGLGIGHSAISLGHLGHYLEVKQYESFVLNFIMHGGLLTYLLVLIIFFNLYPLQRKLTQASFLGIFIVALFQQSYENPSILSMLWVLIFYLKVNDSKVSIN